MAGIRGYWPEPGVYDGLHLLTLSRYSMSSVQVLIDQKAALEAEIARTIKAAEERKKALEVQIAKQRAEEVMQGRAEIKRLMEKYNLSAEEAVGIAAAVQNKPGGLKNSSARKRPGYLAEIRQYYSGRAA